MADGAYGGILQYRHPIDYPLALTSSMMAQFQATGIINSINMNTVLAYHHSGEPRCCVFEGPIQPRLLDRDHYYVTLGSGKISADPFVRFLVDVFAVAASRMYVKRYFWRPGPWSISSIPIQEASLAQRE